MWRGGVHSTRWWQPWKMMKNWERAVRGLTHKVVGSGRDRVTTHSGLSRNRKKIQARICWPTICQELDKCVSFSSCDCTVKYILWTKFAFCHPKFSQIWVPTYVCAVYDNTNLSTMRYNRKAYRDNSTIEVEFDGYRDVWRKVSSVWTESWLHPSMRN